MFCKYTPHVLRCNLFWYMGNKTFWYGEQNTHFWVLLILIREGGSYSLDITKYMERTNIEKQGIFIGALDHCRQEACLKWASWIMHFKPGLICHFKPGLISNLKPGMICNSRPGLVNGQQPWTLINIEHWTYLDLNIDCRFIWLIVGNLTDHTVGFCNDHPNIIFIFCWLLY